MARPKISAFIEALDDIKQVFPPLKHLAIETFWFVLVIIEIIRYLRDVLASLWK